MDHDIGENTMQVTTNNATPYVSIADMLDGMRNNICWAPSAAHAINNTIKQHA